MSKTSKNMTSNPEAILDVPSTGSSGELQSINVVYRLNGKNYLQWSSKMVTDCEDSLEGKRENSGPFSLLLLVRFQFSIF